MAVSIADTLGFDYGTFNMWSSSRSLDFSSSASKLFAFDYTSFPVLSAYDFLASLPKLNFT